MMRHYFGNIAMVMLATIIAAVADVKMGHRAAVSTLTVALSWFALREAALSYRIELLSRDLARFRNMLAHSRKGGWKDDIEFARALLAEAGVDYREVLS